MAKAVVIPSIGDFKRWIGEPLGPSEWVVVDQSMIDRFADATGDRQWIHVDPERAAGSPFGGTVAHGYLTIALAPALIPQLLEVQGCSRVVNYGIDKLRLPSPVPAGARLRLSGEIKHVRVVPGGAARVTLGLVFEVERGTRPVCTADAIYVYFP